MSVDIYLFHLLNDLAESWFLLDFFFYFCAKILPYFLLLPFFYLLIKDYKKNLLFVGEAFLTAFLVRYAICEMIRSLVPRLRPYDFMDGVSLLVPFSDNLSLPSGHVSFLFALATVTYFYNKKMSIVLFALSSLVGISRVYVGVHWPSDIVAGALVGVLSGLIVFHLVKCSGLTEKLEKKLK